MKSYICFIALASAVGCSATAADSSPATGSSDPTSELSFLTLGKNYVIHFPESVSVFTHQSAGMAQPNYITADGAKTPAPPATWSATMTLLIFRVVKLGGESWALLEHPTNHTDVFKWSSKRRAMAVLAGDELNKIESQPDGKKRLEELRKEA